jgi:hypothetical protein
MQVKMYKPPSRQANSNKEEEPIVCFANVKEEPVKHTKYVCPSNRGSKAKTFEELFPTLGDGLVTLKLNRPSLVVEEKKEEDNKPKSFAERIKQKLDKEREELEKKTHVTKLEEADDDGHYCVLPPVAKYLKAVEATRLRRLKEIELRNKIFESESEEEAEIEVEEDLYELYGPSDDDEEENDVYEPNEDRHN